MAIDNACMGEPATHWLSFTASAAVTSQPSKPVAQLARRRMRMVRATCTGSPRVSAAETSRTPLLPMPRLLTEPTIATAEV